jgi:hypothetical protein
MSEPTARKAWGVRMLALSLVVILLGLVPSSVGAQSTTGTPPADPNATTPTSLSTVAKPSSYDNSVVRAPDSAGSQTRLHLLEHFVPDWREQLKAMPPFIRDTDLNIHFRSFYFNRQNDNDTASEAWALGGWIQYVSGLLLDTFQMGATYYTSLPAYAPDSRPGSLLLTPGQDAIGTFGEAWGSLRYKDYAILKGYRQKIDEGYVNPQDNRMVPNTFEAITLGGRFDWFQYDTGYVMKIKPRDSNDFISMSKQAGAGGDNQGLFFGSFTLTPIKELNINVGTYFGQDTFNTAFGKAEYTLLLGSEVKLQLGVQYTDQRSVEEARVGNFNTWNVGAGARMLWRGLSVGGAMHFTGDQANISSPWGGWPGYLSMQVTDFDRANEKAFGLGVKYDFGGSLLPFTIPGLSLYMAYVQGNDRINPSSGSGLPTTREGDLDIIYNVPSIKGLSMRFRNAYVGQGNNETLKDFRIIFNYELDIL